MMTMLPMMPLITSLLMLAAILAFVVVFYYSIYLVCSGRAFLAVLGALLWVLNITLFIGVCSSFSQFMRGLPL